MKTALIIGAGPAGLTAAFELLDKRTGIHPVVFESAADVGGIAKTVEYKGNRIDLGGHRFFSKSDRVMDWWRRILPPQGAPARDELLLRIRYQGQTRALELEPGGPDPERTDQVMLVRRRLSRIFYLRRFFRYPVSLDAQTMRNLGPWRIAKIGASYARARLFPVRPEVTLEDFFVNRFGRELYLTFFKDYTEKVWGVPCREITAEWGAQRVKGLSVTRALAHAARAALRTRHRRDLAQKELETSLIEHFLYPKLGPGQMWQEVTRRVLAAGGEVHLRHQVLGLVSEQRRIVRLRVRDLGTGEVREVAGDYVFSSMPVQTLIASLEGEPVPANVREVAAGLQYRDFITVGLLLRKLKIQNQTGIPTHNGLVPDNWIYIQERDVKVGRLQIFNNWSPYMVKDPDTVWIGLEYFVQEGDEMWRLSDAEMARFGIQELVRIGVIEAADVLDSTVLRMEKTYPAYFGTYERFAEIRAFVDGIENLFLIGRNGMHKYNNQDHSMLAAMVAVENLVAGVRSRDNLWSVNAEQEYHEEK